MKESLVKECEIIKENCEHTAEAHFIHGKYLKKLHLWFNTIPAITAAISSTITAGNLIPALQEIPLYLTVITATISAIATVLDPKRGYEECVDAGRKYTILKHKARSLIDTIGITMTEKELKKEVFLLQENYYKLVEELPPTDDNAFDRASERIRKGIHEPK